MICLIGLSDIIVFLLVRTTLIRGAERILRLS